MSGFKTAKAVLGRRVLATTAALALATAGVLAALQVQMLRQLRLAELCTSLPTQNSLITLIRLVFTQVAISRSSTHTYIATLLRISQLLVHQVHHLLQT